jgi:hypothetical protein
VHICSSSPWTAPIRTNALRAACDAREISSADDRAAVLDWRLDDTSLLRHCPLPWLPGLPDRVAADPKWGPYLHARSHLVAQLAN